MEPLATLVDLRDRCDVDIVDGDDRVRAQALLRDASGRVRSFTGQEFTLSESTDRLAVRNGRVRLPQRPVVEVTAMADTDGNDVTFVFEELDLLVINGGGAFDQFDYEPRRSGLRLVDVTYEHGYEEIPDTIVGVVCQMAGRAFGRPADQSGVTSETEGPYSVSYGTTSGSGAVGMLDEEKDALRQWKREAGTARAI